MEVCHVSRTSLTILTLPHSVLLVFARAVAAGRIGNSIRSRQALASPPAKVSHPFCATYPPPAFRSGAVEVITSASVSIISDGRAQIDLATIKFPLRRMPGECDSTRLAFCPRRNCAYGAVRRKFLVVEIRGKT